ncbi:MAG: pyridoxal phosphate-dependent aminotransferase [Candidatus Aenigmarchaeota archaeon]|nr:pyridoxal phosphate-dependent aminotransferase [Candidatus Aenigmarchaeota archaeon]
MQEYQHRTHISERELQLHDVSISKLLKIAVEDKHIISLGPGEPDFLMSPVLQKELGKLKKYNHYSPPGGRHELKEAIAKKLRTENKINCNAENIVVTCGSQEALTIATAVLCDVTEEIIIPEPSFFAYLPTAELFNAVPVAVGMTEQNDWQLTADDVEKAISKKTQAIILNTPSNPTGAVLSRKTLEEIADVAVENDIFIFSDEAYEKIIYDSKHVSIGSFNGMQDYVITLQTFSKSHAMAGFRVGYCCAPREIAQAITKTQVYTTISAPTVSQMLALKALKSGNSYTNKMVKSYKQRRNFIVKRLNEIGLPTKMPDGAFYSFSNISDFSKDKKMHSASRDFAAMLLKKAKVAVVPGIDFGKHGEGYIRCSYASDIKKIEKAMDRIEKTLR